MANQESIAAQNSNLEKELLVMRMRVAAYEAQSPAASPANSPGGSTPGGKTELSSYCATPAEVAEIEAAVAVACPAGGADVDKSALADRLAPLFAPGVVPPGELAGDAAGEWASNAATRIFIASSSLSRLEF